ncbi:hypothetical protein PFISCL1PPCAC_1372, partial [Pristionchus fissidentatus]
LLEIFTIVSYTRLLKRNEKLRTCMNDELSLSERCDTLTSSNVFHLAVKVDTINIIYLQGIIMPTIFLLRHRKEQLTERNIIVSNRFSSADFISRYENEITKGW